MEKTKNLFAKRNSIMVENDSNPLEAPNTKITYMYRDGSNYKAGHSVVLGGRLDSSDVEAFIGALDNISMVPGQVDLKDLQDSFEGCESEWDPDLDHPFHEVEEIAATSEAVTEIMTAAEFIQKIKDVKWNAGWEPSFIGLMEGRREDRLERESQESKRSVRL